MIKTRISYALVDEIDKVRGDVPRERWIRNALWSVLRPELEVPRSDLARAIDEHKALVTASNGNQLSGEGQ